METGWIFIVFERFTARQTSFLLDSWANGNMCSSVFFIKFAIKNHSRYTFRVRMECIIFHKILL